MLFTAHFLAPQTPQNLQVIAINSSTLRATWQLVTCFNSSGDLPTYILSIKELNSQYEDTITKPGFCNEHYFVNLSGGLEYKVSIKAVNRYDESNKSFEIVETLKTNGTDKPPPSSTTMSTAEDALPIIIGGAVGGAILAIACISVIVIIVIVVSCIR